MTELVLGTAEFNNEGYGNENCPEEKEIVRILNLAWEAGIKKLDCADTYGTERLNGLFSGFNRINKTRNLPLLKNFYYHYRPGEAKQFFTQASVYDVEQLEGLSKAVVPMSLANTKFTGIKHMEELYVRSVFDRGNLLKEGYTLADCLSFVYRQRPTGIIVGVKSVKELEEIMSVWNSLKSL